MSKADKLLENFNGKRGPVFDRNGLDFFKIGEHRDLIKDAILRLIFTRKGTRMGNLDYGTAIPDLPFTNNAEALKNLLSYEISEALEKWEPRIDLIDIVVTDIEEEFVRFHITYMEIFTNTTEELPVTAEFV